MRRSLLAVISRRLRPEGAALNNRIVIDVRDREEEMADLRPGTFRKIDGKKNTSISV